MITWYSRAPTMPNGMATTIAISRLSGLPPRSFQRRPAMTIATTMPAMMQSAYARSGNPARTKRRSEGWG